MLTRNQINHIRGLGVKKYRWQSGEFTAEGEKVVDELLDSPYSVKALFVTADRYALYEHKVLAKGIPVALVTPDEMKRLSSFSTPSPVLAVAEIPAQDVSGEHPVTETPGLYLMLDDIRDPGNLGTIIRIADWFGIRAVLCSEGCVDCFNPKVVQATMGSLFRIPVLYQDNVGLLGALHGRITVYGTLLRGDNIFETSLNNHAIIIIGNESQGISEKLQHFIHAGLFIPSYSETPGAESLNASVACAIVCAEFRRREQR